MLALLLLYFLWREQADRWKQVQDDARGTSGSGQGSQGEGSSGESDSVSDDDEFYRHLDNALRKKQEQIKRLIREDPELAKEMLSGLGLDVPIEQLEKNPELLRKIAKSIDQSILNMMDVATRKSILDLDLESRSHLVEQNGGEAFRQSRRMRGMHEIPRLRPSELALPDTIRKHRLATRQAKVMQGYTLKEEQKVLVVLEDVSPSMSEGQMKDGNLRSVWAKGVILNLARQAIKGKSWFYYRPFSSGVGRVRKITTREEAKNFLEYLFRNSSSGSGTDISAALRAAAKDIKEGAGDITKADILLVSDGEDSGLMSPRQIKNMLGDKTQLHVIIIGGGRNETLREVAKTYKEVN